MTETIEGGDEQTRLTEVHLHELWQEDDEDFPDKLRIAIDRMDAKTRRTTFRVIAKASAASGFEAAVRAGEHLVEQGHAIDEASVTTMARRIAAGEKPYEQSVPDLTGYDVFMKPRQPWERKEA